MHASGHSEPVSSVQPKNVIPIHGEVRHSGNGQLAVKTGIDPQQCVLAETRSTRVARVAHRAPSEYVRTPPDRDRLESWRTPPSRGSSLIFASFEHDSGMSWPPEIHDSVWPRTTPVSDPPDVTQHAQGRGCSRRVTPSVLQQAMRRVDRRWVARRLRQSSYRSGRDCSSPALLH